VKGLLSHALAYALAGVIAALVILEGRSVLVRSWLHIPVVLFLAVNVAATIFAADQLLALYGAHGRMVGLGTIADGVLLYFAIVLLVRTKTDAIYVFASGLAASLLVVAYAFVQFAGRDPIAWNASGTLRPFSTLGQPTSLALYLTVVCVGAAALGILQTSLPRGVRWFLLLLSAATLAGLISTQTRSALLGLGAAAAVLVALTWLRHPSRRARMWSLGASAAAAAIFVLVVGFTPLGARLLSTVALASTSAAPADENSPQLEESADVHVAFYRIALEMLQERPVLGFGPDDFAVGLPKYRPDGGPTEVQQGLTTSAHGWATQIGSGSGVFGLIAFLAVGVGALVIALKAGFHPVAWSGAAMLAAFLGAGVTTVNAVSTDWLFWASAGLVVAATARGVSGTQSSSAPWRRQPRAMLAVSSAVFGAAFAFTAISALNASHAAHDSQQLRLADQPQAAIDAGLRATALDSLRAPYWDTLGLAYVSANRPKDAVPVFDRATSLAPYDIRYSSDLARAYVRLIQGGDATYTAKARATADLAVRTDPNNPQALATRGLVMAVTGDLPEAVGSIEKAVALDPHATATDLYVVAAQIYRASGRYDDAIAVARQAIEKHVGPAQDTVQVRIELARALAAAGQTAQAITELDAALAIAPNDPVALGLRNQFRSKITP
jgi:tetratricopeptide (TPR) repeat protein/O-antigen ligase